MSRRPPTKKSALPLAPDSPRADGDQIIRLKQSLAFIEAVLDNIPNMIFVKDAHELRFVRFNKAGEELLGYRREDLIGKNDYDFFPKSEADFFTSMDRDVLAKGGVTDIPEEPIQTRHHGPQFLHTKKIPILNEDGEPEFLLGISENITEKKQAEATRIRLQEEKLARAEAEKAVEIRDDFIAVASHELRTPLTPLKLNLELLSRRLEKCALPEEAKNLLRIVAASLSQVDRMTALVEDLLDVSRISAGRMHLEKTPTNLSQVIQTVRSRILTELQRANCALTLKLEPGIIGKWDASRIEQVLTNLLTNALKYGKGKPIEIESRISRSFSNSNLSVCELSVRDHGIGIAPDDQLRIFERFERAVSTKMFGGIGLGLYITREIVTAHGGSIRIESAPGQGSRFIVELPLGAETLLEAGPAL